MVFKFHYFTPSFSQFSFLLLISLRCAVVVFYCNLLENAVITLKNSTWWVLEVKICEWSAKRGGGNRTMTQYSAVWRSGRFCTLKIKLWYKMPWKLDSWVISWIWTINDLLVHANYLIFLNVCVQGNVNENIQNKMFMNEYNNMLSLYRWWKYLKKKTWTKLKMGCCKKNQKISYAIAFSCSSGLF